AATTYTYDARNRIRTAVDAGGTTTYTYFRDGKKETVTHPNGTGTLYTYHPTNRIETILNQKPVVETEISTFSYEYDKNGNNLKKISTQNGAQETTIFRYDALDRLLNFAVSTPEKSEKTEYTYHIYNRKTEIVSEAGIVKKERNYYYDETNWLTLVEDVSDYDNPFNILYFYDKNGNTITRIDGSLTNQEIAFTYNSLNQLVQTTRGPPGARITLGQYDYSASGLRVRHRFSERGDVDYFYDEYAILEERNAADDSLLAHYTYADRLLSLNAGDSIQYYHHDALGSTVNLTDSIGN
ncbi:MAG: hypothetical protein GY866_19190, partial [Proteobacteria bacterium]|nr:hypothetical protein [Pseudomonadota bacterium]